MPWDGVHVVQVDERVVPAGGDERNLTHLRENLLEHSPLRSDRIHAMPVELSDLHAAAASYAKTLQDIAGSPPVLDLVHLVSRTRWPHGLFSAWRSGTERYRQGRCCNRHLSGETQIDVTFPAIIVLVAYFGW